MDLETPKEAMLRADNARLKAENSYLRRAIEAGGDLKITPFAAIDERTMPTLPETITLPTVGTIHGGLSRYGDYHVMARLSHAQPEDMMVRYYAPGDIIKHKAMWAVNELFPYMHEQFIRALASALRDRKAA